MDIGKRITGTVNGVMVSGYWTGRGIKVSDIHFVPLTSIFPAFSVKQVPAYVSGVVVIQVGAEYILDGG